MVSLVQLLNQTEFMNAENIIHYYKEELLSLKKGEKIVTTIPLGTRKRLIEYGIIRLFGSKFELTNQGNKLLKKI